ncbi:MAG: threonine synthase [Ruminococcaceae bacterium]|nr:threonine synthase [Oscillospiraceae bacterium]
MNYTSTRNDSLSVSSAYAIANGISEEGGLFVPTDIPEVSAEFIESLVPLTYIERARKVLSLYLTDFTAEEIDADTFGAYSTGFTHEKVAPLVNLHGNTNILELWHGPTCAFKDMALQLLPYLLTSSAKKTADGKEIVILVATSGDTGKAALEGFKDVDGTRILVFYPSDGVSAMQKLQMTTQQGKNVGVCAIKGNFDDAQTGVKTIFTDPAVKAKLLSENMAFSSANSINWGRLVPQIVYYFSAYADMIASGQIKNGDKINFTVPTGNFGNILAAYYAMKMGLPVNKLICASNENNVLTEFINTGRYNRVRQFHTTVSPSMDILVSSNLERLIFHLSDKGSAETAELFGKLKEDGEYTVSADMLGKIQSVFSAGCCNDCETKKTIGETFSAHNYLLDPHTAVAVKVYNSYKESTGDTTPTVIVSTASPYKFTPAVLEGLGKSAGSSDEFDMIDAVVSHTGVPAPKKLTELKGATPRFTQTVEKTEMEAVVLSMLGI